MSVGDSVMDWLLNSDPAIRWQVLRDVLGARREQWSPERALVADFGWGARLLSLEDADGQWAGAAFLPAGFEESEWEQVGQPWTATAFALDTLREFGLDPTCEAARRAVRLIGENSRWEEGNQPFWEGEVEECINGRTVASGAYFGVDVAPIVERLITEQQADGGWNCERANGSVRSSFHSTINVLEGLLGFERATGGTAASRAARAGGEEFLLARELCRRLSTGKPADARFLLFTHPSRWRYDVLRGLDYFRDAADLTGNAPDPRLADAIDHVRSRQRADGSWPLDRRDPGRVWFEVDDEPGESSRWVTLRALRVLQWWDSQQPS